MPVPYDVHLFAGPTLYLSGLPIVNIPQATHLHSPAARGDIEKVVASVTRGSVQGVIVLVDGIFHQKLAVSHQELRLALDAGWQVFGLSSLGAIRAFEMRGLGMQGAGRVYRMFESHDDFQDDEVALLHEPDVPYRALSEPLVNIRYAVDRWVQARLLSPDDATGIIGQMKTLWFGDRHVEDFRRLILGTAAAEHLDTLCGELDSFDLYRIKTWDLRDFVETSGLFSIDVDGLSP